MSENRVSRKGFKRLPPNERSVFWEDRSTPCIVGRLFKKKFIFATLILSIPVIFLSICIILFPLPVIPEFTIITYFSTISLFAFIYSGGILTFLWNKNTFYEYFDNFEFLRSEGIIKISDDKFKEYFQTHNKELNRYNIIIIVGSALVSIGISFAGFIFFQQHIPFLNAVFWAIEYMISWFFIALIVFNGLKNVFITIGLSKGFVEMNTKDIMRLNLNPLHPDRFGGLSGIGEIAVETSLIVTIICLLFPWFFDSMRLAAPFMGVIASPLIILAMVIIIIVFIITFFIPTFNIYIVANREKDRNLEIASFAYEKAFKTYKENRDDKALKTDEDSKDEIQEQLRIMNLGLFVNVHRNRFIEMENMKVFPFSVSILTKFFTGLLIPIAFILFQEFLL